MIQRFYKYEGAGNDFILFDNRDQALSLQTKEIEKLCDRHFGIGADGLILIQNDAASDFEMIYFNADGHLGSMCGNGARCAVHFAHHLRMIETETVFKTYDGIHRAAFVNDETIKVSMSEVENIGRRQDDFLINSGSPHYVKFVPALELDVFNEGRKIRYNPEFKENGVNVNFVLNDYGKISMRTYERGVENETLSCGTGTVAAAIATYLREQNKELTACYEIQAPGGILKIYFKRQDDGTFSDIWLEGSAKMVFSGEINMQ
jgi:diaminopimelate epimerase